MTRLTAMAILFALAFLLFGSTLVLAWEENPPGPISTATFDPGGGGRGDTDPDDFPIHAGSEPTGIFDQWMADGRSIGPMMRLILVTLGRLPA